MKFRIVIVYVSAALFIFLSFKSCFDIGVASTKNDHLIEFQKMDIDKMQNLDSVKNEAKYNLELLKKSRHEHSDFAQLIFLLIVLLFILQLFLWKLQRKEIKKS